MLAEEFEACKHKPELESSQSLREQARLTLRSWAGELLLDLLHEEEALPRLEGVSGSEVAAHFVACKINFRHQGMRYQAEDCMLMYANSALMSLVTQQVMV